jgi:homocysteine S-methyltransferase
VDREYRVLTALGPTDVPVPRTYALCEDPDVVGTAFYIMEYVHGRLMVEPDLPGVAPAERAALFDAMNLVLARLHAVDPGAVGLSDYGRPGNYLSRQIDRWTRQYRAAATETMDAMERLRAATSLPISAQPNAGIPRSVEGRNIYLCSPEYMASYARKFVAAGVRLVGGCCGTTPEHIRVMKSALRATQARAKSPEGHSKSQAAPPVVATVPLVERSRLGAKIAYGEFVTMVEIVPPKGTNIQKELEGARFLKSVGVDGINIPDSPRASARMSNQALSLLLQQQSGIEAILHYTCRDRNVLCIQSDLLGAAAIGIKNLICITGDPPKMGGYPDATAVFDVDAIGLVNIVHNLNRGLDIGGNPMGTGTSFAIGVGANPGVPNIDEEIHRFEFKVQAGAEYAVTQPVFDLSLLEKFLKRIEQFRIPVVAGIWPLVSARNAEFMKNELRVSVPDSILERMTRATSPEAARQEGIIIAREMLIAVRSMVQGAQISAPQGRYSSAADVLEALGGTSAGATAV